MVRKTPIERALHALRTRATAHWGEGLVTNVARDTFRDALAAARENFIRGNFTVAARALETAGQQAIDLRGSPDLKELPRFLGAEVVDAFGHLGVAPMLRVKAARLGLTSRLPVMIVTPNAANSALVEYWCDELPSVRMSARDGLVLERALWPQIDSVQWMEVGGRARHLYSIWAQVEREWERAGLGPVLTVSDEHHERGQQILRSEGVEEGAWFASLHVRALRGGHSYGRNADESSYREAIQLVHNAGGQVIQFGQDDPRIQPQPGVISLSTQRPGNPWLDLFLLGTARFHIGTQSGPSHVANAFGTPVLMTNVTGWGFLPYMGRTLALPKAIALNGRPLTLQQMIESGLAFHEGHLPQQQDGRALSWVDNTPEQIAQAVGAMLSRHWTQPPSPRDNELNAIHEHLVGYPAIRLATHP